MRRRMFLLAAVVAVAGCVGRATRSNPFDGGGTGSRSIRVEAVNRNFNQATLEALGPVQRRLGIVPGNGRRTFTLTWPAENELRNPHRPAGRGSGDDQPDIHQARRDRLSDRSESRLPLAVEKVGYTP